MTTYIGYCKDFKNKYDLTCPCCDSCHEEQEYGFLEWISQYEEEGTFLICCSVFNEKNSQEGGGE